MAASELCDNYCTVASLLKNRVTGSKSTLFHSSNEFVMEKVHVELVYTLDLRAVNQLIPGLVLNDKSCTIKQAIATRHNNTNKSTPFYYYYLL